MPIAKCRMEEGRVGGLAGKRDRSNYARLGHIGPVPFLRFRQYWTCPVFAFSEIRAEPVIVPFASMDVRGGGAAAIPVWLPWLPSMILNRRAG